jgi:aerobic carbon-monoxide dehydrogenase medium subunit
VLGVRGGRIERAAIGLTNLAATPLLAEEAAAGLIGKASGAEAFAAAARAAEAIADPATDGRGPADYRRRMAGVMVRRALARAAARAA